MLGAASLCAALATASSAGAAQLVQRYALEQLASAPYYQVTLNDAVYAASHRGDLSDLRILNSAGEPVPYTFDSAVPPAQAATVKALRWFALPATGAGAANPADTAADQALNVTIGPDGGLRAAARPPAPATRGGDVIDLGADGAPLSALLIHLQDSAWQGRVEVSTSGDLRDWTPVIQAPLLKAVNGGATLVQERVELDGLRSRYVRLRWPDGAPILAGVEGEFAAVDTTPPTRAWRSGIETRNGAAAGEYLFDTGGAYPVDRVQFDLPQTNTVARGQLYSRPDAQAPWRLVAEGQLLRLQPASATADEQRNPPWAVGTAAGYDYAGASAGHTSAGRVDTDRQWRLLVDTRGGGLGSGRPTVALGWRSTVVTFVARGSGPFVLAVGDPAWGPAAVSLAELMPANAGAPAAMRIGRELAPMPASVIANPDAGDSKRRYVLWIVLIAAVGLLGVMAWRLSRSTPRAGQ
ncbi:hypothetical protein ASB57_28010 [Bordetella sp. N]|nr:hypothetical protein ASB57_28010 [Bordetella sp. N]